jgi:hypothetical protein
MKEPRIARLFYWRLPRTAWRNCEPRAALDLAALQIMRCGSSRNLWE